MGAGASGEGGHPDFGMSGVSVPGSSGFGEQRGFGNNVSAIGLATNPSLQHDIAHVQLGYNVPGYTEMDDNPQRAAMIDGMRHAMGVRALDQAGLSPSLAGLAMDAREMMSDQQERDFQNNAATASFLDANPNAGIGDIAAAIGSASQGYGNPHGFAVESPLDMSMAMASTEDDPWGVNPQQVMDTSLKAIALKAAKELSKKPRFIYASTATIYGLTQNFPVSEDQAPNPITCYDTNKLSAEQKLKIARSENLIESVSLRLANVYGPSKNESSALDRGILTKITRQGFENKSIKIYGSGNYIRDYVYIDDVVQAFLLAGFSKKIMKRKVYNVGSGQITSLIKIVNVIKKNRKKVSVKFNPTAEDSISYCCNSDKFEHDYGWKPMTSLSKGIVKSLKYFGR